MRILEHFVGTPSAGTIGWALLHSLWEGAMIAALLAAALMVFRSPRARYAAACTAMLAMLAAFAFTLIHLIPEQGQNGRGLKLPILPLWNAFSESDYATSWNLSLSSIAPWLGPIWLSGVWFICLWRAASWVFVQRLRRRGLCCASDYWLKKITDFREKLRVSRPVLLMESCLTDVPVVLGHFRPMILVPIGLLTGLPAQQVEAILLHELAHISRHDYVVNTLQRLAETAFFYHPAAWWITRVIRTERENCCDDVVVSITGNAHEYAVALAALEENRISSCEPALAATGGQLMKRIHRMLRPQKPQSAWAVSLALGIFLATAAASFAAWQSQAPAQESAAQRGKTDSATPTSYSKWLDEDVVYIIDDAERGAFLQLTTDEERNHFIEQFWERRNPTPGSVTNKFKEEHYRRIAYANQHFRTASGAPGWHTDRGHIYVVYGPPDEIESHPKGQARPFATETWLYRHVEVTTAQIIATLRVGNNESITFIDRTGRGDFQLAPGNPIADAKPESASHPTTRFALGDLKLEGEVHDRDGVSTRRDRAYMDTGQDAAKPQVTAQAEQPSPPSCRYCPNPEYPPEARRAKIPDATVFLEIVVLENGDADKHNIRVLKEDPPGDSFGDKAVAAVKNWKFNPTIKNGKPIKAKTKVEVRFRLAD
jgi:TonB family protein